MLTERNTNKLRKYIWLIAICSLFVVCTGIFGRRVDAEGKSNFANMSNMRVMFDNSALPKNVTIIDDFTNNTLPSGNDGNVAIGWVTWGDDSSSVAIETITTANAGIEPVPNKAGNNEVIQLKSTVSGFGGFSHLFESAGGNTWISQDWSNYHGVSFWYYGTGTGTDVLIEINENRNPNSTTFDAEIWTYTHKDIEEGWQLIEILFTALFLIKQKPFLF